MMSEYCGGKGGLGLSPGTFGQNGYKIRVNIVHLSRVLTLGKLQFDASGKTEIRVKLYYVFYKLENF